MTYPIKLSYGVVWKIFKKKNIFFLQTAQDDGMRDALKRTMKTFLTLPMTMRSQRLSGYG